MTTRLYGIVWRWHFLAGFAAFPVLAAIAGTGALYVFQDELERWTKSALFEVAPSAKRRAVSLAAERRALAPAVAAIPPPCQPASIVVHPDPARTVVVACAEVDDEQIRWFIDPHRGALIGSDEWHHSWLGVVFQLHWDLMLGERGRLAIEWATSWAVLLMASGAYLWWPRGRHGGTWWPRRSSTRGPRRADASGGSYRGGLREAIDGGTPPEIRAPGGAGAGRRRLRDLHAIAGAYALPVALAIAATGLCWTPLAGGDRWDAIGDNAVEDAWRAPPRSHAVPGAPRIALDAALAVATAADPGPPRVRYVQLPVAADDPYAVFAYAPGYGAPSLATSTWLDAYSGAVLRRITWRDLSAMGAASNALYSIHIGAIAGMPGRIAALIAALVLVGLCVTGPWMWWKRRPRRGLGVPPAPRRIPWPLLGLLAACGALLPMVGWTLVAAIAIEAMAWGVRRLRAARRGGAS